MNPRTWTREAGGVSARSHLERGGKRSATPLCLAAATEPKRRRRCALPAHCKAWRRVLAGTMLLLASAVVSFAQNFALDWWTLDGGGGTSTNGQYSLSGTLGQPEAGGMSGGPFTLIGGFWGIIAAIQTPGAPYLSVMRTATNTVVVSWPAPAEGWRLHATTNLVTGGSAWTELPPPYQTNGANLSFTEPSPTGNKFYRLHKP